MSPLASGSGPLFAPAVDAQPTGAANVAAATRLTMILFIRSPQLLLVLFCSWFCSCLGTSAAFAPLHIVEKMAKSPRVNRPPQRAERRGNSERVTPHARKHTRRLRTRPGDSAASWWVQDPLPGPAVAGSGALYAPVGPARTGAGLVSGAVPRKGTGRRVRESRAGKHAVDD